MGYVFVLTAFPSHLSLTLSVSVTLSLSLSLSLCLAKLLHSFTNSITPSHSPSHSFPYQRCMWWERRKKEEVDDDDKTVQPPKSTKDCSFKTPCVNATLSKMYTKASPRDPLRVKRRSFRKKVSQGHDIKVPTKNRFHVFSKKKCREKKKFPGSHSLRVHYIRIIVLLFYVSLQICVRLCERGGND
jgi:hypothetical protein